MKTRIIQTRFYDDEFIVGCDRDTKDLYLYLLTCSYINVSGYFQLTDKKIVFESKLTAKELKSAQKKLSEANKAHFKDGWVYVVNARKNNSYLTKNLNEIAVENEKSKVPSNVFQYFEKVSTKSVPSQYQVTSDEVLSNNNSNNNINTGGSVRGETTENKPIDQVIQSFNKLFSSNFQVTEGRVRQLGLRLRKYSVSQVLEAIENLSRSKFHRGENDRGWRADPDFLLRSDEQIDRWLNVRGGKVDYEKLDPLVKGMLERMAR